MADADTTNEQTEAAESAAASAGDAIQSAGQRAGAAAQRAGEVLGDVAGNVASTVQEKAPVVIEVSRTTAGRAAREVQGADDDELQLGTVFSAGLALGLVVARAPRLLVWAALVPVFVLGGTLLSRRMGIPGTAGRSSKAAAKSRSAKAG